MFVCGPTEDLLFSAEAFILGQIIPHEYSEKLSSSRGPAYSHYLWLYLYVAAHVPIQRSTRNNVALAKKRSVYYTLLFFANATVS